MQRRHRFIGMFAIIFISFTCAAAAAAREFPTNPTTNNGEKWRIGYYEGGPYAVYPRVLRMTVTELMKMGWIEQAEIPPTEGPETDEIWNWLSHHAESDYIEFVEDAYYTANWDENLRQEIASNLLERLISPRDVDLMIAMGTWAGQDLSNEKHQVPSIVVGCSDPLGAGIIKDVEYSGYDYIHARLDPTVYQRQVRIFHNIVQFDKLGVAYTDTVAGRSYAALDSIKAVAQEKGFEIVPCYTKDDIPDQKAINESVKACFDTLGKKADAIYVTLQNGVNDQTIPELVEIAHSHRIPTFSQLGSSEVRYGFLMSLSREQFRYVCQFNAETIAKVLNGAMPGEISQINESPQTLAVNLKTAKIIGFEFQGDIWDAVDEVYHEIVTPPSTDSE